MSPFNQRKLIKLPFFLPLCLVFTSFSFIVPSHIIHPMGTLNRPVSSAACLDCYDHSSTSDIDTLPIPAKKKLPRWEFLFDGKSTSAWRGVKSDTVPSGWKVEKGALFLDKKGTGDIYTKEEFSNFELVFDFNLTENANSGIKYFVGNIKNKKTGDTSFNGIEYQIIDDYNHPEVKDHKHDVAATASCYLLYPPQNVKLFPAGQWNHGRIISKGKHVEHRLNGIMVLEYERGSADFLKRKAITKFKDHENYGELPSGHILITDHNDVVYFKNIKIRRL